MNNPQAFPCYNGEGLSAAEGMTLLDYCAAKAMQTLLMGYKDRYVTGSNSGRIASGSLVYDAYDIAEQMLIEREKRMK